MPPPLRHQIEALSYVLTPYELDELLALPRDGDRIEWIDEYWSLRDPVFTTPENEVRIEHGRRVAYAESAFSIPRPPMWDQRGELYIRYGPPSSRELLAAETDQVGVFPRGEVWHYGDYDMVVLFEDVFSRGEYTYYTERVDGPKGSRLGGIEDPIDASYSGMLRDLCVVPPPESAVEMARDKHIERILRFYDLVAKAPSVFSYDLKRGQLPFVFSIDNFRGGEHVDRVDVNIEFEAQMTPLSTSERARRYVATAIFWDTARREVARRERKVEFPVCDVANDAATIRAIPVQLVFSLKPGFYFMAVTVEDRASGRISSYRADAACHDFEGRLSVSDILFAARIEPSERMSPFRRGALEVVPHPLRRYQRSESIPVYFEVYNLGVGEEGTSSYTVEYEVVRREIAGRGERPARGGEGPPEVSSTFRQSAYDSTDVVYIELRSDGFRVGAFDLRVKITDNMSRAEARREASFSVVE
jgi:GWxTD domain-containing protein